jgi:hypothetical protein
MTKTGDGVYGLWMFMWLTVICVVIRLADLILVGIHTECTTTHTRLWEVASDESMKQGD